MMWDPHTYLQFSDERSRPFADLLARVRIADARSVVDLGCGPGHLGPTLRARWPQAHVVGVDSSARMIEEARTADRHPLTRYVEADLRTWRPDEPVDVLITNAALQWVPDHLTLLPELMSTVAPGGALAIGVPANFDQPSHTLLRALAAQEPFAAHLAGVTHPSSHDGERYLETLAAPGWDVDVWETTYLHVLQGPDPVLSWIRGTGARPVLDALPEDLRHEFLERYGAQLDGAYPAHPHGTVLPFRRVFAVAHRAPRPAGP